MFINYRDIQVLIVDNKPNMRTALHGLMLGLGFQKVVTAGGVREALEHMRTTRFDMLLCDHDLGGATDGQQFLEFLRVRRVISRATLFVMVTAEKSYEAVVTTAECMPDDYLIKPFTPAMLKMRIDRLLEKKHRLAEIDRLQDKGRWPEIVRACDEIIAAHDRFQYDALRIKGNALAMQGDHEGAAQHYREVLEGKPVPWAKLGLARALLALQQLEACKAVLLALIEESPRLIAAYDLLSVVHETQRNPAAALSVLDDACAISPRSLNRHRAISGIAERTGDFRRVESSLAAVVERTRNTPLADANDYARLGTALVEVGEPQRAIGVLNDAKLAFRHGPDVTLIAAVESIAQAGVGRDDLARAALDRALQGSQDVQSEPAMMALARACLVSGEHERGEAILRHALQNNPHSATVRSSVTSLMTGGTHAPGKAQAFIAASVAAVEKLNNDAVRIGQAGDLPTASRMLTEAAARLPDNLQIVANASYALLHDVLANGADAVKVREARRLQAQVQSRNREFFKLAEIDQVLAQVAAKYGPELVA